jgi:ribulose 1,5-bisphosphate synthetase/thiazole synthase
LQKCSPYAKYDQDKCDADKKDGKHITVMQDKEGVQYFAKWISSGTYSSDKMGDAFMAWIHSLIDIKLGDKELNIKTMINTFNSIKKAISEVLMMSTLFRIRVDMMPVPAEDMSRLIAEEKRARKLANADQKKVPIGGLVGPDTVFSSQILDREARNLLTSFKVEVSEDGGGYSVDVDDSPVNINKSVLSSFNKEGNIELVKVKNAGDIVSLRGAKFSKQNKLNTTPKKIEVVTVDAIDITPEVTTKIVDGVEVEVRRRGRPKGTKNKKKDDTDNPIDPNVMVPPKFVPNEQSTVKEHANISIDKPIGTPRTISAGLKPKTNALKPKTSGLKPKTLTPKKG